MDFIISTLAKLSSAQKYVDKQKLWHSLASSTSPLAVAHEQLADRSDTIEVMDSSFDNPTILMPSFAPPLISLAVPASFD